MLYIQASDKSHDVEFWGTKEDLEVYYHSIREYWGKEEGKPGEGMSNEDSMISIFSQEIRKASYGERLTSDRSKMTSLEGNYVGFKLSWPRFILTWSIIKKGMFKKPVNALEIAFKITVDFWIQKAAEMYSLEDFIKMDEEILITEYYGSNKHLRVFCDLIEEEYKVIKDPKKAFHQLNRLLNKALPNTESYSKELVLLEELALKYKCEIDDLETTINSQ